VAGTLIRYVYFCDGSQYWQEFRSATSLQNHRDGDNFKLAVKNNQILRYRNYRLGLISFRYSWRDPNSFGLIGPPDIEALIWAYEMKI
jgi:hypothetical protein